MADKSVPTSTPPPPTIKKYQVWPGLVRSKTDGQEHYIRAEQLIHLYGVDISECIVINPENQDSTRYRHLKILRPLHSGKYPFFRAAGKGEVKPS